MVNTSLVHRAASKRGTGNPRLPVSDTPVVVGSADGLAMVDGTREALAVQQFSSVQQSSALQQLSVGRRALFAIAFSLLAAAAMVWGRVLSRVKGLEAPALQGSDVALGVGFFVIAAAVVYALLWWMDARAGFGNGVRGAHARKARGNPGSRVGKDASQALSQQPFSRKRFLLTWAIIFVIWIPVLLAYWPTIWAYDVYNQVPLETNTPFYALHPLLHTLFIQGGISLGKALGGGSELGMVLLSLVQMGAMSGIFAFAAEKTRELGAPAVASYALLAFFTLAPFNPIMALSQTKDTLFAGCFLVLFLLQWQSLREGGLTAKRIGALCLFSVVVLMLRNNAVYAFVAWIVLSAVLPGRGARKVLTSVSAGCLVVALALNAGLFAVLGAKAAPPEEAYSVPMQSLARIACLNPEYVPAYGQDATMFDGLVLRDEFPEDFASVYQSASADPVKSAWIRSDAQLGGFSASALLEAWAKYSIKHPADSVVAWSLLTKGAWYPLDKSHAHVYDYRTNLVRQGYLLTDYKIFDGMDTPRPASKLPGLEALLERIATDNVHHKSKLATVLLAPASYAWLLFFLAFVALYRREGAFPILLTALYFATVLLGPLIVVRYMYPVMLVAPTAFVLQIMGHSGQRPAPQRKL